ncbi:U1 zinc finger [Cordyceps militaris]|uniref:U1 zinc finger n=1 Tax=Cordyceps militaris TaxID=73501 RepID=A0A2H4SBD0_CORMI|nr:U1 zinc finger [Cordyceps militaris]
MSEYWKSTPRYWCKYCAVYVRDTKLERANHDSTARHQGALKRSLRDLHRSHDRNERDKERAKREIDRLNGVVAGESSSAGAAPGPSRSTPFSSHKPASAPPPMTSEASLKKQREQLAELGVAIPGSFRPEMAMPGEWTVTSTRVIETRPTNGEQEGKVEARASGVRKREENEEEKEEEAAVRGLFKKSRRWGRDAKAMPDDQEAELDALLNGSLVKKQPAAEDGIKQEEQTVKEERQEAEDGVGGKLEPAVKEEPETATGGITEAPAKSEDADSAVGAVVFKKRKPKGLRTK